MFFKSLRMVSTIGKMARPLIWGFKKDAKSFGVMPKLGKQGLATYSGFPKCFDLCFWDGVRIWTSPPGHLFGAKDVFLIVWDSVYEWKW